LAEIWRSWLAMGTATGTAMGKKRKHPRPHKRKSPEELQALYASEAKLRADLDELFVRIERFAAGAQAEKRIREAASDVVKLNGPFAEQLREFQNALLEVGGENFRLIRQNEDLERRIAEVETAHMESRPVPPLQIERPTAPDSIPNSASLAFVLDLDADQRERELTYEWTTGLHNDRAQLSFGRVHAAVSQMRAKFVEMRHSADRLRQVGFLQDDTDNKLVAFDRYLNDCENYLRKMEVAVAKEIGENHQRTAKRSEYLGALRRLGELK